MFYPYFLEYSCNFKESSNEIDQASLNLINQLLLEDKNANFYDPPPSSSNLNVNSNTNITPNTQNFQRANLAPVGRVSPPELAHKNPSPKNAGLVPKKKPKHKTDILKSKFRNLQNLPNLAQQKYTTLSQPKTTNVQVQQKNTSPNFSLTRKVEIDLSKPPFSSLYQAPSPLLIARSAILKEEYFHSLCAICNFLPTTHQRRSWDLIYSTDKHGFSIRTFYAKMLAANQCSLLIIEDTRGYIFGGFASCPWRVQELYFGTGECFLFRLAPIFGVYSGHADLNHFFMLAKLDHFEMGGGYFSFNSQFFSCATQLTLALIGSEGNQDCGLTMIFAMA